MVEWYDEPGITMLHEAASHLASSARGMADGIAQRIEALPDADEAERGEILEELETLARMKNPGSALAGLPNVGDFLVMVDMTAMAYGLKPVGSGPGPVAQAGWKLQEQGPVFDAARRAAVELLDGDGDGDLGEYYALVDDNPPPPAPGLRHLHAVVDEDQET